MSRQSGSDHWMHRMPERVRRGPAGNGAKLTEVDIEQLCAYYVAHRPRQTWLAAQFGISRMTVWRHLKAAGLV